MTRQGIGPDFADAFSKAGRRRSSTMSWSNISSPWPSLGADTKDQAKKLIAQFGGIGPLLAADAETLKREGLSEGVVAALKIAEATL